MNYKYILSEEEFDLLNKLLEERIEVGGDVERMKDLVKLYEHISDNWQEAEERKK